MSARCLALLFLALGVSTLVGCKSHQKTCCDPASVASQESTPAILTSRDAEMFEPLKALVGSWGMTDENGVTMTTNVFEISSAGSVVREIMLPGHGHEMTNLYHMDGPNLVITHYCAAGNQPRMVAREVRYVDGARVYHFKVDSVSNVREGQQAVMDEMILTIGVDGSLRQEWYADEPSTGKRVGPTLFEPNRLAGGS